MKIGVREVKNNLSKYGDIAHNGQTVTVSKNGVPWFDLVPHRPPNRKVNPMSKVSPTTETKDAIAPIDEKDLPGWI